MSATRGRLARLPTEQRSALLSVFVAVTLLALKLTLGLISHSLGLIAEAIHSATDLLAALLTLFAVRVAVRPADEEHPFGHMKAEHLSALAEGSVLAIASLAIVAEAVSRLAGGAVAVETQWYVIAVPAIAIVLDASRWLVSARVARRAHSAALEANALHFASDLFGSAAVLVGLLLVRAGNDGADSIAALVVAALVLLSAGRLMRRNVQSLMDSAPHGAEEAARAAVERVDGALSVPRLRVREAGGRHFADVVIGVAPGTDVAGGHAIASAVETAIGEALPGSDVVVHVEPDTRPARDAPLVREGPPTLTATIALAQDVDPERAAALAAEIERELRAAHGEIAEVTVFSERR